MIRFPILLLISMTFFCSANAQKVHRAAKALNELKFDKSIELFEEVLKKDSNNIVAMVGFVKAHLKECEVTKKKIPLELLQTCYNLLLNARSIYEFSNEENKKLLSEDLNIYYSKSITELLEKNTYQIWQDYLQYERSVTKFEHFQSNYFSPHSNLALSKVFEKLDILYYDSIENRNTLNAYKFYLNKFNVTSLINRGKFIDNASAKIIELEYKEAINTDGVDKLKEFLLYNPNIKNGNLTASATQKYFPLANQELNKREFNLAILDPGITLLTAFVKKSPRPEQYQIAKDTIEHREYNKAKNSNLLNDYVQFKKNYSVSKYLYEVEDSIATFRFREISNTNEKKNLVKYIDIVDKFHKNDITNHLIDSAKSLIYNIDFDEASNTTDLNKLKSTYQKYKLSNYPNLGIIKSKLFIIWEENIVKNNTNPSVNGFVNFVKEFKDEPSIAFTKVIDATKTGLFKYAEHLKTEQIKDILMGPVDNSKAYKNLSEIQLESLASIINNKLIFIKIEANPTILEDIKNLDTNYKPTDIELFKMYITNFKVSSSYIETLSESPNWVCLLAFETKNAFVTKLITWDEKSMKFKESEPNTANNTFLNSYLQQRGYANFSAFNNNGQRQKYNFVLIGTKINPETLTNKAVEVDF